MKRIHFFSIALLGILGLGLVAPSSLPTAEIKIKSTYEYAEIDHEIRSIQKEFDDDRILVVLDIDNTILTSQTDLGSDIWYEWQSGKLDLKPTPEQKVPCLFEDAIGLLFELGRMDLVEPELPAYIRNWQESGIAIMALTSRDPRYRSATERELSRNGVDLDINPLTLYDGEKALFRYEMEREVSYMKGIMMTTGQNKGIMLQDILERTGSEFDHIIFVDDTERNIENMYDIWKDSGIDMRIYHYERILMERREANGGSILTEEQAWKMHEDWMLLQEILTDLFPGRLEDPCMTLN